MVRLHLRAPTKPAGNAARGTTTDRLETSREPLNTAPIGTQAVRSAGPGRLPSLDGLRALAILGVLACHAPGALEIESTLVHARAGGIGHGEARRQVATEKARGLHVGNALDDALGARLAGVIGVTLQRGDHILGADRAAVMVFNAAPCCFPITRYNVQCSVRE